MITDAAIAAVDTDVSCALVRLRRSKVDQGFPTRRRQPPPGRIWGLCRLANRHKAIRSANDVFFPDEGREDACLYLGRLHLVTLKRTKRQCIPRKSRFSPLRRVISKLS